MLLALLIACPQDVVTKHDSTDYFPGDADADGWTVEEGDCDDDDFTIHPGAVELWYDDVDQDCSGGSDHDQDGDGVEVSSDCDDLDPDRAPGLVDDCDGIDDDCDGSVDEDAPEAATAYVDADYDGWGVDTEQVSYCDGVVPPGYALDTGDCDDGDRTVAPDALELCDEIDNDCDTDIDENAVDSDPYYQDVDLDGYGNAAVWVRACEQPEGWADNPDDCDDTQSGVHPGADEYCNERDDDCDGNVDENAIDRVTNYLDADGDGYGDPDESGIRCDYLGVADNTDCDDADASANPGATEVCDLVDNDCDAGVDEDLPVYPAWSDADGDGHGDATLASGESCGNVGGVSILDDDCNDADATISPSAAEVCDGVDNDCSGDADSDAIDATWFYIDADADGYGVSGEGLFQCDPSGAYTVTLGGDCDDADATRSPAVVETDDDRDEDCDGWVDEDFVTVGDIVVTEVARQTWMGGTSTVTDGHWFEVYNSGTVTIDLANWLVSRSNTAAGTDSFSVDPSLSPVLEPGDYAVFCESTTYTMDNDPNSTLVCDYFYGDSSLADSYVSAYIDNTFHLQRDDDTLALTLASAAVDSVTWSYDATTDTWPRVATYSMQLSAATVGATENDDYANWCATPSEVWYDDGAAAVEYGTPGLENEDCP